MIKEIREYIDKYDFKTTIKLEYERFLKNTYVQKYIESYGEEGFVKFSNDFWEKPGINITKLKQTYSIPNNLAFSDIIKAYSTDPYISFLKMCWEDAISIESITQQFALKYENMEKLLLPIIYLNPNDVCPNCCNSNIFLIKGSLQQIKHNNHMIECGHCHNIISDGDFISPEDAEINKQAVEANRILFEKKLEVIKNKLDEIKCPRCQAKEFSLKSNLEECEYDIICNKCGTHWDQYDVLVQEYDEWRNRAAMMIKIKEVEQDIINKLLDKKDPNEIILKQEDIIKDNEAQNIISHFIIEAQNHKEDIWKNLYSSIKKCNRAEKLLLIKIIELYAKNRGESIWTIKKSSLSVTLARYTSKDEPVVNTLIKHTHMVIIRKLLKSLMDKKIIACGEESNFIDFFPLLIENIDKIKNLLTSQNIDNDIKYFIFKRDNYTCGICGETGRPLKIAYLSTDKNYNHLEQLISVCDICYSDVTDNEVMVDGFISIGDNVNQDDSYVSWKFVTNYIPEIKSDPEAYENHCQLINKYDEGNAIKALASSIEKLATGKIKNNINSLYSYAAAIIKNSDGEVIIPRNILDKYMVEEWVGKL